MRKIFLCSFIITMFYFQAYGQNPEWINYTNYGDVRDIAVEGDYIWVATNGGLVSINKITRETIFYNKANSGLPDNYIRRITIDEAGNKWMVTGNMNKPLAGINLVKFDGSDWTVFNESNSGLPDNEICDVAFDDSSNMWIGISNGLAKFDGSRWITYKWDIKDGNMDSYRPYNIVIDNTDNKWILVAGSNDGGAGIIGLSMFDGVQWTHYNWTTDYPYNSGIPELPTCISIDEANNKWIGTHNGLTMFDGIKWTVYNTSNSGLPDNSISGIGIDKNGTKWIATDSGMVTFDGTKWTVFDKFHYESPWWFGHTIVAIDDQNNKWIERDNGLVMFNGNDSTHFNISNSGLSGNSVNSIAIDNNRNVWMGIGRDGDIVSFNGSEYEWAVYHNEYSDSEPPFGSKSFDHIVIDNNDIKWVISDYLNYLYSFDGNEWTHYDTLNSGLPFIQVNDIAIDKLGNKWIGTYKGLLMFDGVEWTVYNTSNSDLPSDRIEFVAIDDNNIKWIVAENGLYHHIMIKFDGNDWSSYSMPDFGYTPDISIPAFINCFAVDHEGINWICTGGDGLYKFDGSTWTNYNSSNSGLNSDWLNYIAFDNNGNKWIAAGDAGMVKFDGSQWTEYREHISGSVNCIAIDKKNNKWIATDIGLTVFNEKGIILNINDESSNAVTPKNYLLSQNYPNPFNPTTKIRYQVPTIGLVSIRVYNLLGEVVATLVNEEKPVGTYELTWNAVNLSSGVYFYQLQAGNFVETKKMILLR